MSSDINTSQYLKAFSVADSKKRIDEIDMILNKKMGNDWRRTVFLMLVVIAFIILLIVYGINIDNNPYKNTLSHIKVFFIILLISISFFFIWVIIKPRTDNVKKGVVPFPPADTLVPIDSTQCGLVPTECTNPQDCKSACTDKDGKYYYSCQQITHPNTYYLGTKLEVGKSYCLPNIAQFNDINQCGTYTGRIVWAKNPDGTLGWQCQCLYPDLFEGSDCTDQKHACKMEYDDGIASTSYLKDSKGNIFSPTNAPPGDVKTPYDLNADGTPRFKCSCVFDNNNGYSGFYSTDDDPFTCNKDICTSGTSTTDDGKFDPNTNTCICKNPLVKSNISGFCYPPLPDDSICNLHPTGNGCRYGVDLFFEKSKGQKDPVIFKNNDRYYMADKRDLTSDYLLDITDLVNSSVNDKKSSFIDITDTIFKDAFYSYPIKIATSDYLNDIIENLQTDMKGTLEGIAKIALFVNSPNSKSGLGLARKCNSYYNKWDGVSKNCEDPLSTTGTEPLPLQKVDCGDGTPVINISHYPWGYNCDCGTKSRKEPGCGKVLNGPHMVENEDGTNTGKYQVKGQYIDRILCNDEERAQKGLPPQPCVSGCLDDGTKLASGQDVTNCCFYELDENKNPIANFRSKNGWLVPTTTLGDGGKNEYCGKRARSKCSKDQDCIHDSGAQYGCSFMDKGNSDQICCPSSSYELIAGHGYWCNYLDTGDKCYGNDQCNSGVCNNGKSSGKNQNDGGGTCA